MAKKKSKLTTPEWILEGYDSPEEYEKSQNKKNGKKKEEKVFKLRVCPKCQSDEVKVVEGEVGIWECKKCKWNGENIEKRDLTEKEFMEYLDKKGEDVA